MKYMISKELAEHDMALLNEGKEDGIEKAFGTKYKSKKLINGKWRYYYADGREESVKWYKHNANKHEIRSFIRESFENSGYSENIKICDLPSHFSDKLKLKIGNKYTKLTMNSFGVRHSLNLERHNLNAEDILLLQKVIQNKHTIIRSVGKSQKRKSDLIEFTGYSRGTIIFILAIDPKNEELKLFDCYRKTKIEKSVRSPCTSPETNALDGSQPILIINYLDEESIRKYEYFDKSDTKQKQDYNGKNVRNKSFIVGITDITENNKAKKVEQLEKALNAMYNRIPFGINHVPADDSARYQDVELHITDFSKEKIEKAVRTTAFSLGVPLKSGSGETFYFDSQKELTDIWCEAFSKHVKAIYDFVTDYFELPEMNVMSKSNLKHKGKILYNPETGKPISTSEWNRFVTDLEKFLNRNKPAGEKIVLDAQALGRLLDKMLKTNSLESVRKMALKDIKVKEKSYEWVSDSVKHLNAVLGSELAGEQMARIEMLQRSAAQKVAGIDNAMKDNIKQILIDGVTNKKSKSQVSQDLFDKMVGHTRDFQRLADTEIQKNLNDAYIAGEINNTEPGENVYFQRVEVIDGNTCDYCKKMNGKIAVWSKTPLSSGKVSDKDADLAIWEGKEWDGKKLTAIPDAPVSIFHPWCRGIWLRYDPEVGTLNKALSVEYKMVTRNGKTFQQKYYVNNDSDDKTKVSTEKNSMVKQYKTIESIHNYMSNQLVKMGFELENNHSGLSGSEYITIKNWSEITGEQSKFNDDEFKIRVSDHDLPPSYDGLHGYHDIDIYTDKMRSGNDGNAIPYFYALKEIAEKAGKSTPIHAKEIIENYEKQEKEKENAKKELNDLRASMTLRERFDEFAPDVVSETYAKLRKYVFDKYSDESRYIRDMYDNASNSKQKKKANYELKKFAETKGLMDRTFSEI